MCIYVYMCVCVIIRKTDIVLPNVCAAVQRVTARVTARPPPSPPGRIPGLGRGRAVTQTGPPPRPS